MLRLDMTLFLLTSGGKQCYFVFQDVAQSLERVMQGIVHRELHLAGMTSQAVDLLEIVCAASMTRYVSTHRAHYSFEPPACQ